MKKRTFAILLFITAFCLKAFIAVYYNAPQTSDFGLIYDAALKLSHGDLSILKTNYFELWSYQTGIVSYYALLLKLGCNIMALKLINCLFIAGVNVLIYMISDRLAGEKCSRFISVLYLIYPATFFLCSVLTNQHISNFFILLGVYLFIYKERKNLISIIPAAVSIAVGNAFRPQGVVIITALLIYLIMELISGRPFQKFKKNQLLIISAFLIVYLLLGKGFSLAARLTGVNENGLENNFPLYKFVIGLNYKTSGCYSLEDVVNLVYIKDKKVRDEKSLKTIEERLSDGRKVRELMVNKFERMWVRMDGSIDWGFKINESKVNILGKVASYQDFKNRVQKLEKVFYCFVYVLAAAGILAEIRRKECIKGFIPIILIISANFAVYCVIEIQPRYRDFQMIFIFLLAAVGLEYFTKLMITNWKSTKNFIGRI
ncbi:MAG TPA: hypothetical protein VHP38_14835 [Ruminiclostridium sp.]|nr:hypothetical protein [Ruminiclostridium sp.]